MAIDYWDEALPNRATTLAVEGDGNANDLIYRVHSTAVTTNSQESEVYTWANTEPSLDPHPTSGEPLADVRISEIGNGWWEALIRYGAQRKQDRQQQKVNEVGYSNFSFTVQGVQQHIRQGISLVKQSEPPYLDAGSTTNPVGEIGKSFPIAWDDDRVNGIDIIVPEASWQEQYTFAPAAVTQAYRLQIMGLVGKLNNATFKGAAAKYVLLTGIQGSRQNNDPGSTEPITLSFTFAYREPETVVFPTISGDITMTKDPWDVWDFYYRPSIVIAAVEQKLNKIKHVYVHQVYETGDFSLLGIGT